MPDTLTQVIARVCRLLGKESKRPPQSWAKEKIQEIKKGNPSYSEEQARKTMGDIWYNNLSESKRQKIKKTHKD